MLRKRASVLAVLLLLSIGSPSWGQGAKPPPGPAVDATGGQAVDPTKNVNDLVQALKETLKELRASDKELFDAKLKSVLDLADLRSKYEREQLRGATDQLGSEARLRAEFNATIAATEKARVDAIRLVDTGAVAIANERATATASALAKTVQDSALVLSAQVTKSADDVRTLVKTTADEQSRNLQQQFTGIATQFTAVGTRLTALEQAGAEGVGRSKFQDPNAERVNRLVETLVQSQANSSGMNQGSATTWALIGTIGVMMLMLIGTVISILNMKKSGK